MNGKIWYNCYPIREDTIATLTCESGYHLEGNNQRQCQSDGNWTGTEPLCKSEIIKISNFFSH